MMIRSLLFLAGAFVLFAQPIAAQRTCSTMEVLEQKLQENPGLMELRQALEQHTQRFIQQGGAQDRAVYTIPVVVHVVYKLASENISDAQIQSQIQVLNDDFRRLNADKTLTPSVFQGVAADCEVNFCLATRDPNGNATSGIVRKSTTVNSFTDNDNVKFNSTGGSDAWDASQYLNLWVCTLGGGLLGYAQFPNSGPANTDGVVCLNTAFGTVGSVQAPFHKGRTATHEVGHWLNCYHIWGDDGSACTGSDLVTDTPNQGPYNVGCPGFPKVTCNNGPNGDMFMNYMDYTDDACMNLFTTGQKNRMQAVLAPGGARASLASSLGCSAPSSCGTPSGLNATGITNTSATLNWSAVSGANTYNLDYRVNGTSTWTTISGLTGTSYNLSGLTIATTYNFRVQAVCTSGSGAYSAAANFTTTGSCTDTYENNNNSGQAKTISTNTNITAKIGTASDKDWFKFTISATTNIKIELTNLPADYDIRFYNSNLTQLAISQNGGTANETIIRNNSGAGTYYIQVYGYNGAFNNSVCYNLKVSTASTPWQRTNGQDQGDDAVQESALSLEESGIRVFPNPASDLFNVDVQLEADADAEMNLVDASGKTVVRQERFLSKGDNRFQVPVAALPTGLYTVQVRMGDAVFVKRLVKE